MEFGSQGWSSDPRSSTTQMEYATQIQARLHLENQLNKLNLGIQKCSIQISLNFC
jgi:hypothetical protein